MRPKSLILIVISLGCGLVASIGISQVMDGRSDRLPAIETQTILVAAVEINVGEIIDAKMIKLEDWPQDKIPEGALIDLEQVEGERPRQRVFMGEPILEQKLISSAEIAEDAADRIHEGYRAVTVKVTEDEAVAGLLNPGDRVDVLAYLRKGPNFRKTTMKTILEDVRVFAVNRKMDRGLEEGGKSRSVAKTVTLEVLPSQVEVISLANEVGKVRFSARPPDDETREKTPGAIPADLLDDNNTEDVRKTATRQPEATDWTQLLEAPGQLSLVPQKNYEYMDIIEPERIRRFELSESDAMPREVSTESIGGGFDPPPNTRKFDGSGSDQDGTNFEIDPGDQDQ